MHMASGFASGVVQALVLELLLHASGDLRACKLSGDLEPGRNGRSAGGEHRDMWGSGHSLWWQVRDNGATNMAQRCLGS